jgi:RNA polymerase sigma-70 factor (ECF subfamily)
MNTVDKKVAKSNQDKEFINILNDKNSSSRAKEFAFNKLYSAHQKNVGHFFSLRVSDADTAEDLKMITFEKVYENISKYDDKFAFSTWLYNIAKNTYIDHVRKENANTAPTFSMSEHEGDFDAIPFQIKSDSLSPEQEMMKAERVDEVRKAIDSIENDFVREILIERFINDLSFEQIAKKLSIENNSTLRVTIRRGKESLKEMLTNPYA